MRIAVNTRLLLRDKLDGIGYFAYETLKRITKAHPEHQFIFVFDRRPSPEFLFSGNITPAIAQPQARHPLLWYLFFEWGVPSVLKDQKADFFLSPDGWLSLRTSVPSLPVIHDLNWEHYPRFTPWQVRQYYRYYFQRFARKAVRIATVSEFTRGDISSRYGIGEDQIDVVYNGAGETCKPLKLDEIVAVRKQYSSGAPYFLFVGTIHPRKNLKNLLLAFDEFRLKTGSNVKLVVAGSKKWWTSELETIYSNLQYRSEVVFVGRVTSEDLGRLVGACLALAYVSFFEGFGIPILEGMNCDVPVIAGNASSMPEVGADAALYVDPASVESITGALVSLSRDEQLRQTLITNGRRRRNDFSWDRTAGLLWESMERAMRGTTR